ncbi:MAG: ABC transporter ATP-binding protein [Betaproteobacteria bacterium]
MPSVIVADQLTKHYGNRVAVDSVSFEVGKGEVLGLLGPNGSGKSTILRMLTGYLHPTSGRARIAGFDVTEQGLEARRRIGYVPEDVPLYPGMRVDEFLEFMGRLKGLDGRALGDAVERVCDQLSLERVRNLAIGKLSRGYRQRVAIAQALLNSPDLLILDEPTNGLDPRQIIEVRELIRALASLHTILVTSHILSEIERVATRVAILLDGQLLTIQALDNGGRERILARIRGGSADRIAATLAAVAGVRNVSPAKDAGDASYDFTVEIDDPSVAERVAADIVGAGFGLLSMARTRTDLEDLFLELTGKARQ